jgi:two-component system sensor histidine kinase TctE
MKISRTASSLRRRLALQLLALSAVLALILYFAVRLGAERASEATLDAILGAATTAIAEEMRSVDGGAQVELASGTFSMLAATGEERIFYRIDVGGRTVTGYEDLPNPPSLPQSITPEFYSSPFRDFSLRIAAVSRSLMIDNSPTAVLVLVGQTREGQELIAQQLANRAAALGLAVFLAAVPLSLLAAGSLLRPINRLADAVSRRGPRDLRPVRHPAPTELRPLVTQLNGFIARLRTALAQTETFIAEAAHHIRTPLATMRSEAELALRQAGDEPTRVRLRGMIRVVDESARSAGQLLDHATVLYRADQVTLVTVDLVEMTDTIVARFRTTADLKDMGLSFSGPDTPLLCHGDAVLIEAALRNLIDNALKYSPADSDVMVSLTRRDTHAILTVVDQGRGLAGATLQDLHHRFQRGTNVGDIVGSGLGLTIVTEAMAVMGGTFALDPSNNPGGGTCATLTLPLSFT